ncbi:MAG: hypothetical protein HOF43_09645 [Chloroflexi bacterium]|nr:hypothetical protein [Chloroflexota bacterium]
MMFVPGIDAFGTGEYNAESRATESFGELLLNLFSSSGYTPAWFSYQSTGGYEGASGQYSASATTQALQISARALDEQIRDLIAMARDEHSAEIEPQIVIVAHSLGGAVTARWASSANDEVLDAVKTVFTFDSPLGGIKGLRSLFGGAAGANLQDPTEIARFEYGTSRVDFAQIGNQSDLVVQLSESFTSEAWQTSTVSCLTSLPFHNCSKLVAVEDGFVNDVLTGDPPIWTNATDRPGPLPKDLQITDVVWIDANGDEVDVVTDDTVVTLAASGVDLVGLTITAHIFEADDLSADDEITDVLMEFSGKDGVASWTALATGDEFGDSEYFFTVLGFEAPLLTVTDREPS